MQAESSTIVIPQEIAYRICDEIRAENRRKPYKIVSSLWCWGCTTFTGGDPQKRCGATVSCPQVVKRYGQRIQ